MADDERDSAATGAEDYESPAVEQLGSASKLTAGDQSSSLDGTDDSDLLLKEEVRTVEHPLELLRAIRTP